MQMTIEPSAMSIRWAALVLAAATAAACHQQETAPPPPRSSSAPAAQPAAPSPPVAPPADGDRTVANSEPSGDAIVGKGRWAENHLYRFRLERVAACDSASPGPGPAQRPVPSGASQFRGETSWVGAFFSVEAKQRFLVSPRDLELHRGGVILNSAPANQRRHAGCEPRLPVKALRAGESLRGFALFEVPKRFRARTDDPIVFSYRPTRWGGARKVEVPIGECFDACKEPPVAQAGETAGRSRPASRTKR
jgi:hypothetical protein